MTTSQISANRLEQVQDLGSSHEAGRPDNDLAWLELNVEPIVRRVMDLSVTLKERLRLQSIACDRLDEFFAKFVRRSWSASARADSLTTMLHQNWQDGIQAQLAVPSGMRLVHVGELTPEQQLKLRHHIVSKVWPLLTPLAVDQGHPFPALPDRRLNLAVVLCKDCRCVVRRDRTFAIVTIPSLFGRIIESSPAVDGQRTFVLLEEAIASNIGLLFPGFRVAACSPFRITRARAAGADGPHELPLSRRQVVRLEISDATSSADIESLLRTQLGLEASGVFRVPGPMCLGELSTLGCRALQ